MNAPGSGALTGGFCGTGGGTSGRALDRTGLSLAVATFGKLTGGMTVESIGGIEVEPIGGTGAGVTGEDGDVTSFTDEVGSTDGVTGAGASADDGVTISTGGTNESTGGIGGVGGGGRILSSGIGI